MTTQDIDSLESFDIVGMAQWVLLRGDLRSVLFVAALAVDAIWGVFVLTGVEHARMVPGFTSSNSLDLYDMPYSHGLLVSGLGTYAACALAAWWMTAPSAPRALGHFV